jgi:hypothetical protein
VTEGQIKAITVGEPLAVSRSRIGTRPPGPGREYEVMGLPEGVTIKLKRDVEQSRAFFHVRNTLS